MEGKKENYLLSCHKENILQLHQQNLQKKVNQKELK